jgi:hypothetical protein
VPDYETCTSDDQCRNQTCLTGRCAETCRPEILFNPCPEDYACARAVGPAGRPAFNLCQETCQIDSQCRSGERCVWRDVYQGADDHAFVCAKVDPDRRANGVNCKRNDVEGDDQCQGGLCFGCLCTRPCTGPLEDCTDVAPDAVCELEELRYGGQVYQEYVCSSRMGVCGS